jgi:hypothetical protein
MGLYDTVGKNYIQIKSTPDCSLTHYKVGDEIDLPDGLHIGYEGWFIVSHGKIMRTGTDIYDKWGNPLITTEILLGNPVAEAIKAFKENKDEKLD